MCLDDKSFSKLSTPNDHKKKPLSNSSKSPSWFEKNVWEDLERVESGEDGVAATSDEEQSVDDIEGYGVDEMEVENEIVHLNPPIKSMT